MIHLFNKVYLKHESLYDSHTESIVAFSEKKAHPISSFIDLPNTEAPSFEELLISRFEGQIEKFWQELLLKDTKKTFNLFVDPTILNQLLIQYWKSIFKSPTADALFRLYNFFILDRRLKNFLYKEITGGSRAQFYKSLGFMSREQFNQLFEITEPVKVLQLADKGIFSFEYLLADYFYNSSSARAPAFRNKLKTLAWKAWFNEAEIIKGQILNGFYDIKKVLPFSQIQFESIEEVEHGIRNEPLLNWILDDQFREENIEYVRKHYHPDTFIRLHQSMNLQPNSPADEQVILTEFLFAENYEGCLQWNIKNGFGCLFIGDRMKQKANQILTGFIYDQVRSGRTQGLKDYELF